MPWMELTMVAVTAVVWAAVMVMVMKIKHQFQKRMKSARGGSLLNMLLRR